MKKPVSTRTVVNSLNIKTILVGVLSVLLLTSVVFIYILKSDTHSVAVNDSSEVVSSHEHIQGNASSSVRVVLYSDIECPYCNSFYDYSYPKIMMEYGSRIAFLYRHYPIVALHPNARIEADATECAYNQRGEAGFWTLLDLLYTKIEKENTFDVNQLPSVVAEAGLDVGAYKKCMKAGAGDVWVQKNMEVATVNGVYKTPTVIVENVATGKSVVIGGAGFTATRAAIESLLSR